MLGLADWTGPETLPGMWGHDRWLRWQADAVGSIVLCRLRARRDLKESPVNAREVGGPQRQVRRSYLLKVSEPYVMVPARVAALIESRTNISGLRIQTRGLDPEATAVLEDIREAAMTWRGSGPVGTDVARTPEPVEPLGVATFEAVTPSQAGSLLGITDRAVRKAIVAGRLLAKMENGMYQIQRQDLEQFKALRKSGA